MPELQEIVYDSDEYAYKKVGESDDEYEKRMARLTEKVNSRVSEEERQQAAIILENAAYSAAQ